MTPFQDEIARIIAGFSHWERIRFSQIGGSSAYESGAEPVWCKPSGRGVPEYIEPRKRVNRPTFVFVSLGGRRKYTVREAAEILNVGEYHLRHRLREDVCVVRGVTVTRLTGKREGNYRVMAAGSVKRKRRKAA